MSNLLTIFLRHFKVYLDQCTPKTFRVVSSIAELHRRLGLSLTEHDINYVYGFQDSKTLRKSDSFFVSQTQIKKWREYLLITRNWYPNRLLCLISASRAGGQKHQSPLISFSIVFDSFLPQTRFFLFVAFRGLLFPKEEAANQFHRFEQVPEIPNLRLLGRSIIGGPFFSRLHPCILEFLECW